MRHSTLVIHACLYDGTYISAARPMVVFLCVNICPTFVEWVLDIYLLLPNLTYFGAARWYLGSICGLLSVDV